MKDIPREFFVFVISWQREASYLWCLLTFRCCFSSCFTCSSFVFLIIHFSHTDNSDTANIRVTTRDKQGHSLCSLLVPSVWLPNRSHTSARLTFVQLQNVIHCVLWGVSSAVHVDRVNRAHSFIAITSRIFHKVLGWPILWVTWTWWTFFFNVWKGVSIDIILRETLGWKQLSELRPTFFIWPKHVSIVL